MNISTPKSITKTSNLPLQTFLKPDCAKKEKQNHSQLTQPVKEPHHIDMRYTCSPYCLVSIQPLLKNYHQLHSLSIFHHKTHNSSDSEWTWRPGKYAAHINTQKNLLCLVNCCTFYGRSLDYYIVFQTAAGRLQ